MRIILSTALALAALSSPSALTDCGGGSADGDVVLEIVSVEDASGDGLWDSGEVLYITVAMSNISGEDILSYPTLGAQVTGGPATITPEEYPYFGILAGETYALTFELTPSPFAGAGTEVGVLFSAYSLACNSSGSDCIEGDELAATYVIDTP